MPVVSQRKENMEYLKRKHPHPLVLNEYYHGNQGDVCYLCTEHILPSPVAQSVYHCTRGTKREPILPSPFTSVYRGRNSDVNCDYMLVHKSCAESPLIITNYFMHPYHPLTVCTSKRGFYHDHCTICLNSCRGRLVYVCRPCDLMVCLKCVTTPLVYHPSHNQHALVLFQRSPTFRCHACGQETGNLPSCKCTICFFWIHQSCATLSSSFKSKFHEHPLLLAYYLPQQYIKFRSKCKICKKVIKPTIWLYYCAGCRIFVHIMCASATPEIRSLGEFGDVVHLPARDESSLNMLRQFLIHQTLLNQGVECNTLIWSSSSNSTDAAAEIAGPEKEVIRHWSQDQFPLNFGPMTWSFSSSSTVAAAEIAGPEKEVIRHWSHDQHPLILRNKCSIPPNIVCGGCTNPINSSNTSYYEWTDPINSSNTFYYECHPCQYFLHRYCAELPKQMQPYRYPPYNTEYSSRILFTKISSSNLFHCNGCNHLKSGIHITTDDGFYKLDIGCVMLLKKIKHVCHEYPLTLAEARDWNLTCNACFLKYSMKGELLYICKDCFKYNLHTHCALRPGIFKHRWDRHPLILITPEDIVKDHPHDFNCEHCSEDIDTNLWFYHCRSCDLSCHISCIDEFYRYSIINFSCSETKIDQQLQQKLHKHRLTLTLNKRKRCCGSCGCQLFHVPVLQCTPCNFIICLSCVDADQFGADADQFGLKFKFLGRPIDF